VAYPQQTTGNEAAAALRGHPNPRCFHPKAEPAGPTFLTGGLLSRPWGSQFLRRQAITAGAV